MLALPCNTPGALPPKDDPQAFQLLPDVLNKVPGLPPPPLHCGLGGLEGWPSMCLAFSPGAAAGCWCVRG